MGHNALTANTTGINNTAVGRNTLASNTFGTNNTDSNIGNLEYCFQMIKQLGLKWQDIWVPAKK